MRLEVTKSTWSLAADSAASLVSYSMSRRGRANAHKLGGPCWLPPSHGDIRRKLARQNKRAEAKARAAQEDDSILPLLIIAFIFMTSILWYCLNMAPGVPWHPVQRV